MKTNKNSINLVEKAMLVMLGERPIQDTTVQRMFDRCVGQEYRKVSAADNHTQDITVKSTKTNAR